MPIIKLEDVSKLYGFGEATSVALDEVNLTVEEGEFVAVMGPSGSGKSTLMNVIALLDKPTHGSYMLNGRSVAKLKSSSTARIRRDTIGYIFQSFNLLPRLTALENVALPLVYKGLGVTRRLKLASAMLDRVGLQEKEYFYPYQLSGGQAQCVAIARALVNHPKVLIADEPTGSLDSNSSRLVMEMLSEMHKTGNTVLFVTHNPELTRYATRVVYMHDGAIIHDEQTKIGEVAKRAREVMYKASSLTEDDHLAGVSALMTAVPQKEQEVKVKKKTTKRRKPARSVKTVKKKSGKKL